MSLGYTRKSSSFNDAIAAGTQIALFDGFAASVQAAVDASEISENVDDDLSESDSLESSSASGDPSPRFVIGGQSSSQAPFAATHPALSFLDAPSNDEGLSSSSVFGEQSSSPSFLHDEPLSYLRPTSSFRDIRGINPQSVSSIPSLSLLRTGGISPSSSRLSRGGVMQVDSLAGESATTASSTENVGDKRSPDEANPSASPKSKSRIDK